jgi:hypothetical protein
VTASTPEVDSRQYIFAYLIRSLEDVPADFPIPAADGGFRLGLFLPRDEPDWFGRSTYPTRILLLSGGAVVILPHPKMREPVIRIPLQPTQVSAALVPKVRTSCSRGSVTSDHDSDSRPVVSRGGTQKVCGRFGRRTGVTGLSALRTAAFPRSGSNPQAVE